MRQGLFKILSNHEIAPRVFLMQLNGDLDKNTLPGQFVNIAINGKFLRRPISICNNTEDSLSVIYKIVGDGTLQMSKMKKGEVLDILIGLGNGYNTTLSGERPLLIGGGVGIPPMYKLAKTLITEGKKPIVILGFNSKSEIFFENDFRELGCNVIITTVDGSYGRKGVVTDVFPKTYTHFYACGPLPMLRAIHKIAETDGQLSFEERMGCGFGACMGCSIQTKNGPKRVCKEGPIFMNSEVLL